MFCFRLRDLTAQDKLEHQRVVKDLEKAHSDLKAALETRDKMQAELKVCLHSLYVVHVCVQYLCVCCGKLLVFSLTVGV